MSDVIQVDDSSFDEEVLQSKIPVLIEFGATWCGPCQRQLPILEKLAKDYTGKLKVAKIDIDDAISVSSKFGIKSVPTLLLFKNGQKVDTKVGLTTLAELREVLVKAEI